MHANLAATHGLPLAEHITALLAPALGRLQAHDLVAQATARATREDVSLAEALCSDEHTAAQLTTAGLTSAQLEAALNPENYLGATQRFITRALAAHTSLEADLPS
jgi:3-carboxy-cis,cis-muconate cycloisomerase